MSTPCDRCCRIGLLQDEAQHVTTPKMARRLLDDFILVDEFQDCPHDVADALDDIDDRLARVLGVVA